MTINKRKTLSTAQVYKCHAILDQMRQDKHYPVKSEYRRRLRQITGLDLPNTHINEYMRILGRNSRKAYYTFSSAPYAGEISQHWYKYDGPGAYILLPDSAYLGGYLETQYRRVGLESLVAVPHQVDYGFEVKAYVINARRFERGLDQINKRHIAYSAIELTPFYVRLYGLGFMVIPTVMDCYWYTVRGTPRQYPNRLDLPLDYIEF